MKSLRVGLAGALMILLIAACGSLGLVQPQSFSQRIAHANGVLTAVINTAATSLEAQQISVEDAKQVRELAEKAGVFLDAAQHIGDTQEGNAQLVLATEVLKQLQVYLNSRSK